MSDKKFSEDYISWKHWKSEFGKISFHESVYFDKEISRAKRELQSDSQILEIGFGNGSFLGYAKTKSWNIQGTEINKSLVKVALENDYLAHESEDLSIFEDSTFDAIFAFDVIEHIQQDLLISFFNEVKRVLKDDGFFLARFPNGDSPLGLIPQNGDLTHVTAIGSGKINHIAAACDLEVLFVGGEAEPLVYKSIFQFIHLLSSKIIKKFINIIMNLIYTPRLKIAYASANMSVIFKKNKNNSE